MVSAEDVVTRMSELVVVGFDDTQEADRALTELVRLWKGT